MAVFVAVAAGASAIAMGATIVTAVAVGVVAAATYDYMMDSLVPDEQIVDTMTGRKVTKKETLGTRKVVIGNVRVGGNIVYQAVSGTNNRYLHYIVAFSGDTAHYLESIYLDDELAWNRLSKASAGGYRGQYSTNEDGSASQTGRSLLIVHKDGEYDQTAVQGHDLPDEWTTDHRLRGICYAYIRFDHEHDRFKQGVPKISASIKGMPLYNPRTDQNHPIYDSSRSDEHNNYSVPSSWDYQDNSAIVLYNYMRNNWYGLNVPDSDFDHTSLQNAIDLCDEDVTITGGTQKRYTCNGIIDTSASIRSNISSILSSMNGKLMYANGKYHIMPYAYQEPHSQVIDDDLIVGSIQFSTKTSRKNLFNTVKGKFVNEDDGYEQTEYPTQHSATYETEDGERLEKEFDQPMVTNHTRAQRLARLKLLRSRMMTTIKATLNAGALVYKVGDTVKVTSSTFGVTEQEFEITNLRINVDKEKGITVDIEARETSEDIFDWEASDAEDFTSGNTVDLPTSRPSQTVVAPTNVRVINAGTRFNRGVKQVKISWDGVQQIDGANPYEPFFNEYIVTVQSARNKNYQRYTTTETTQIVEIQDYATDITNASTTVRVYTRNGNGFLSSAGTLVIPNPRHIYPEEALEVGSVVYGTQATPTSQELNNLVQEKGIQVKNGLEVLYVQLDGNNEPINSTEYEFTTENFIVVPSTEEHLNEVDTDTSTLPELITNGTFDTNSDWTFNSISRFSITGGQLVCDSTTSNTSNVHQTTQTDTIGDHTFTFNVVNISASETSPFIVFVQEVGGATLVDEFFWTSGQKTFNFTTQNRNILVAFLRIGASSTSTIEIDNVSLKVGIPDAVQEYKLYLPYNVTSSVTFEHDEPEADKVGMDDTGVTETYSGFDTVLTERGRKYVKIKLTRSSSQPAGLSQFKTIVTASWTESDSTYGDVSKQAQTELLLTARVI